MSNNVISDEISHETSEVITDHSSVLDVKNLSVRYAALRAVTTISLEIKPGELVSLIGANGAGKSSVLKALMGMVTCSCDVLLLEGQSILKIPTYNRVKKGLVLVPEGRGIFPELTVKENLLMGAYVRAGNKSQHNQNAHKKNKNSNSDITDINNDSAEAITQDVAYIYSLFPRLKEREQQYGGSLSGGEQQMLAIGRALMSRPRLLLLDEPSMGLAPIVVKQIFTIIQQIAASGTSILLVEQNAMQALKISQRAYVLETGQITLSGESHSLLENPELRHSYLGM